MFYRQVSLLGCIRYEDASSMLAVLGIVMYLGPWDGGTVRGHHFYDPRFSSDFKKPLQEDVNVSELSVSCGCLAITQPQRGGAGHNTGRI